MKNLLLKVCTIMICSTLLLSSCNKEPLMGSTEWEEERRNNFYDYKVKNRDGFDMISITPCAYNEDTAFLTGIKNEKIWIGMFDNHTKEQLKEWNGTKAIERTIKIDKGYGDTYTLDISAFMFPKIEKTSWGFTSILRYEHREPVKDGMSDTNMYGGYDKDILFLNGDKVITYSLNNPSIANPCWYQESIVVASYDNNDHNNYMVLSPDGKKLAELKEVPYKEWYIDFIPVSYTEDIGLIQAKIYPNNEEMGQYTRIRKRDHSAAKTIWSTDISSLKNLEDNARINASILEQNNPIWKYQIDVTNKDGSKQQVVFTINVETGKVTEI